MKVNGFINSPVMGLQDDDVTLSADPGAGAAVVIQFGVAPQALAGWNDRRT